MTSFGRHPLVLVVACALSCAACSGSRVAIKQTTMPARVAGPAGPVHLGALDDAQAAARLAQLMIQHPDAGFRVLVVGSDGLGVARGRYKFMLQPHINGPGERNTLVVKQLYAVKEHMAAKVNDLMELCFEVNTTMRFLHASIQQTPHGPLFVARSELPFGDTLDLHLLGQYLDTLKAATLVGGAKRLTPFLK